MSPMEAILTYTPGQIVYSSVLETRATIEQVLVHTESDVVRLLVRNGFGRKQSWAAFESIHEVYDVQQVTP
jgi:hypothetical protein